MRAGAYTLARRVQIVAARAWLLRLPSPHGAWAEPRHDVVERGIQSVSPLVFRRIEQADLYGPVLVEAAHLHADEPQRDAGWLGVPKLHRDARDLGTIVGRSGERARARGQTELTRARRGAVF